MPRRPLGPRAYTPKLPKPVGAHCETCPAVGSCTGYVPARGLVGAVMHLGESPAVDEQIQGIPFAGAAGSMHTRVLRLLGGVQESYRIDNLVRGTWAKPLDADPRAVAHCAYWRDEVAASKPAVVVPMGAVALRAVLALTGKKGVRVQDFHGTVTRDPTDRFWVVPTYHPSHLQRGATNLMGTVAFDLARADEVAKAGWAPDPGVLVLDPPVAWFAAWVETYLAAAAHDPYAYPLAVDIETPEKGSDEGELVGTVEDATFQILRVNVSCNPDEGVTVPFEGGYIPLLQRLLAVPATQGYWFKGYDVPRLRAAGCPIPPAFAMDYMWAWKALQSDLPGGLGFAAPFYSRWGAWKHLSDTAPAKYAAIDALQTRRVLDGITADLVRLGRWDVFARHQHRFHQVVLQPATDIGVPIDRARLTTFKAKLDVEAGRLLDAIQAHIPADLFPLTPKLGLSRPPLPTDIHTKGRDTKKDGTPKKEAEDPLKKALYARATVVEKLVLREVLVCKLCGATGVIKTHKCQAPLFDGAPDARPVLAKEVASVRRWFWQEPFNPDSPDQLMAYVLAKGHTPGKAKATGNPSVDRETLSKLIRETEDPLYSAILDYRAVGKVRSTYVIGTEKRLDSADRVHPTFGFKPSTMRLNATNPNIQNVVADKGGGESLASGFRLCVVAKRASWMIEFDYAGIEQVLMGWFMGDAEYIRIAKLGTHAIVASHVLKRPADLRWPDAQLAEYLKGIKKAKDAPTQLIYDQSKRTVHGCLTAGHDVLTRAGWVPIEQLQEGTAIAQWDAGRITFVVPSHITRLETDSSLVNFNGRGLQATTTPDHRVPVRVGQTNRVRDVAAKDAVRGRVPVCGDAQDGFVRWSPRLALLVAGQADGQLEAERRWTFHLVRPRKVERLCALLTAAGIRYTRQACGCHTHGVRIRFTLDPGSWLDQKQFVLAQWLQLSPSGRRHFLEEVLKWDGTVASGHQQTYMTTQKANAVVVQTLAHLSGRQGLLRDTRRCGFSGNVMYTVTLNRRRWARLESLDKDALVFADAEKGYQRTTGMVYCVTVPSSYFLIRCRDTVSVTGNTAYGLTVHGMMRNFPKTFPTVKSAEAVQGIYFAVAPGVPKFHTAVRDTAYRTHHLGGPPPYTYDADAREVHGHPYGYQHWFWSVVGYDRLTVRQRIFREKRKLPMIEVNGIWYGVALGEDAKRAVAMYPQGTARGVLTEAAFPLFDPEDPLADRCYIGDAWYGETPLRAPIHDSFLMEVPADQVDRVVAATAFAMQRPIEALPCPAAWGIGTHLTINVDAKIGPDWGTMKPLEVPSLQDIGVARDLPAVSDEDEDVDDVLDFETRMGAA